MSEDPITPEPAPGMEPPPLPPKPSSLGPFVIGVGLAFLAAFVALGLGHPGAGLIGIPVVGVVLTVFPRTLPYGLGVLVAFGLSALIALAICGYALSNMRM